MAVYDTLISRDDADALIPAQQATEILAAATQASAALSLCRRARMSTKLYVQPVLSVLPVAYWVDGDSGLKQTSLAAWDGVDLVAEEIATIIPIPEAVVSDAAYPIWAELRDPIGQAFAQKLDAAVFAGIEKPASWPEAIIPGCHTAANVAERTAAVAEGGVMDDLERTLALVEADGYDPTAFAARRDLKSQLRRVRDAQGQLLGSGSTTSAWDLEIIYAVAGSLPANAWAVAGEWDLAVLGVRQDLSFKLLDQSVITDESGVVLRNLAQQDEVALRVVGRFGFAVGAPATLTEGGGGLAYPFAVLEDAPVAARGAEKAKS